MAPTPPDDHTGIDTTPPPTMPSYGTEQARKNLFDLCEQATAGQPILLLRAPHQAVLASLTHLTDTQQQELPSWPTHTLTQARKTLGTLIQQAHNGAPQVLRNSKRQRNMAVLLPPQAAPPRPPANPHPTATPHPGPAQPPLTPPPNAPRQLATATDALADLTTPHQHPPLTFGLPSLDTLTGGLLPGRLTLIAADPGTGGSLLAAHAARQAALTDGHTVLYAASGLTRTDVAARIIAAHAPANYRQLRTGTLHPTPTINQATQALTHSPLLIDDGHDLDADTLATTAPDIDDLALIVLDRLQATPDPHVPLSGTALPTAARILTHTARTTGIPILAALDTTDPHTLATLRPDTLLTLTPYGDLVQVTLTEGDFATSAHTYLRPDFTHARFTDTTTDPHPPAPHTAPEPASDIPRSAAVLSGGPASIAPHRSAVREVSASPPSVAPQAEDTVRLGTAPARRGREETALVQRVRDRVAQVLEEHGGDVDAAYQALAGDGGSAIPDVMKLWGDTREEANYKHTTYPEHPGPLHKHATEKVWESFPNYRHPDLPKHTKLNGLRALTEFHGQPVTKLDVNAAFLAALQSAHLPVRMVTHNPEGWDDLDCYGKGIDLAGVVRINPITWGHHDLPNPLGEDRETPGPLWVPTSVLLQLKDFASPGYGELCEQPQILEAYVGKGSTALFKALVRVLNQVRTEAISEGDELTKNYVAGMYDKLVATIGYSRANHDLQRPEWRNIIRGQAFSNVRRKAVRAKEAGLTVVFAGGTDEIYLTGDVWGVRRNNKLLFNKGRALNEIKEKGGVVSGVSDAALS